jgi:hypothetical protein
MPILVSLCPRCGTDRMTFDVNGYNHLANIEGWQSCYELFSICRNCHKSTIFLVLQKINTHPDKYDDYTRIEKLISVNNDFDIIRFINLKDLSKNDPPDYVPENIKNIFIEGAACFSIECWNAAGTMFRQCLDLSTKAIIPKEDVDDINKYIRENLKARLEWLFETSRLPNDLNNLADCIRQEGNEAAHDGTLTKEECMDLMEFTVSFLERIYTQPQKIKLAEQKRNARRVDRS